MRQPHLIAIAKFIRDLLAYNEQLIKFDRQDMPEQDFNTSYIVVNGSGISNKQFSGRDYDGEGEIMRYSETMSQSVIIEFYGDDAYTNSSRFSILNESQAAADLKRQLGLSVSHKSSATDVKQILGDSHGNRVHVEINITYNASLDVDTLRIDSAEYEITED